MATPEAQAILSQLGGAPPAADPMGGAMMEEPDPEALSPTGDVSDALKTAIEALYEAIAVEPDADDKQVLSTCLQNMLKVQAKNMRQGQTGGGAGAAGGAQGAILSQLGG